MKVKAHVMVCKGYGLAIAASQWRNDLEQSCEEHNREMHTPGDDEAPHRNSEYLAHDRDRAVVTVEFDVPDSVFKRQPPITVAGGVVPNTAVRGNDEA